MEYETIVRLTQTVALVFFMVLFALVVAYVFWPGNKRKFDEAARLPFEPDTSRGNERKG